MLGANSDALVMALVGAGWVMVVGWALWHAWQTMADMRASDGKRTRILKELAKYDGRER